MNTDAPQPGVLQDLGGGVSRILAPNRSPMTHWGTNTYLLGATQAGSESIAVIDPGPLDRVHLAALIAAIGARRVSHILVTHSHLDHSPLARPLADHTGAPIVAFGDSDAGRSGVMQRLIGQVAGGEGVDHGFAPDVHVASGDVITGSGWTLDVLHTPGHFGNHLCFMMGDVGFTGDHLMGWASSLVSPPDGDLTDFMASCHALTTTGITRAYPGHGAPVLDAQARLADLIAHRLSREADILHGLRTGPATALALAHMIYLDTPPAMIPMAARNVLAHLIDLSSRGNVTANGLLSADAKFSLA